MAKGSDNIVPQLLVTEGSTPATAASGTYPGIGSGKQGLFIDSSDHKLKRVNAAGTVTTVESSSSSFTWAVKTGNYTLTGTDSGVLGDATGGAITLTLPTAVGATQLYAIKKKDSSANTVTIATTSAQTIDGVTTLVFTSQEDGVVVGSDGANWYITSLATLKRVTNILSADVTMTTGNTYYDGPTVTLSAGTWLLVGAVLVQVVTANWATAKLWDGTTAYAAASGYNATATAQITLPLCAIVSPASSTTYKISATSPSNSQKIQVAPTTNSPGNLGSYLTAVKIA